MFTEERLAIRRIPHRIFLCIFCVAFAAAGALVADDRPMPRLENSTSEEFAQALRENALFFSMLVSFSTTVSITEPFWGLDVVNINVNLLSRAGRDSQGRQYVRVRVAGVVRKNNNVELNVLDEQGQIVGKGFQGAESSQLSFYDRNGKVIVDGFIDGNGSYVLYDLRLPRGKQNLAHGYVGACWGCISMPYAWYDGLNAQVGGGIITPIFLQNKIRMYWSFNYGQVAPGKPAYGEAEYDLERDTTGAINSVLFDLPRTAASFFANPYSLVSQPAGKSYLPRFTNDTGLAVTNPANREIRVTYIARNYSGALIAGDGIENPVTYRFSAGQQFAAYPSEIFRSLNQDDRRPILGPGELGWIEIYSDEGDVQAMFLEGDAPGTALDGNIGVESGSSLLVFPDLRLQNGDSTEITLLNLGYDDVMVRLELLDQEGRVLAAEPEFFIAGAGLRDFYLGPGSGILSLPDYASAASLRVTCNNSNSIKSDTCSKISGLTTYRDRFGSTANSYAVSGDTSGPILVGAHFVAGPSGSGMWQTVVRVTKMDGSAGPVYLDLSDSDGRLIGTLEQDIAVGGQASFLLDASILPSGGNLTAGYVRVRSGSGRIGGDLSYSWSNGSGSLSSCYQLATSLHSKFHFNQVAQGALGGISYWTGVSLMNDLNKSVRVVLDMVGADGTVLRSAVVVLGPYRQHAALLSELLQEPGYTQIDGYIRVASDDPVSAIVLYGDDSRRFLAAVPGIPR